MIKVSLRSLLLGSAVSVGLIATAGTANAAKYNFGDVTFQLDTTVSAGVSMSVANTDHTLLPSSNGGPQQSLVGNVNLNTPGTLPFVATNASPTGGDGFTLLTAPTTTAGSINTDDGRLNFSRGDLTSGIVKMTNDLSASFQNYKFFGRLSSYYDAVLNSDSSYNRYGLMDGKASAARDVKLLDFYGSADYNVGDLPLNVRAGKQVISWGEGTFMLNGINSINPIDVNAFRRPGAEVKEGLVPVWALDASIGLPYNLSVEAFYQLKWEPYQIDRSGTPFASSDVAQIGDNSYSFLTGSYGGFNCGTNNSVTAALHGAFGTNDIRSCGAYTGSNPYAQYANYLNKIPQGQTEQIRLALQDSSTVVRDEDRRARNSGQWGVATRWYSEDLNNTEFGLYFMNYHSRLPIASERLTSNPATSEFSTFITGQNSGATGRAAAYQGCNGTTGANASTNQPGPLFGLPIGLSAEAVAQLNQQIGTGADPVLAAATQQALNFYSGAVATPVVNTPAGGAGPFSGGIANVDLTPYAQAVNFGATGDVNTGPAASLLGVTVVAGSGLQAAIVNCALVAMQSNKFIGSSAQRGVGITTNDGVAMVNDGAEVILAGGAMGTNPISLYLEYPEDIHMVGASFNTTIGTWGVQGEMSYRSNQPFQLDTDQITIAALNAGCTFNSILGPTTMGALQAQGLDTYGGIGCGTMGTGAAVHDFSGVVRSKMFTYDIGTTATYSNSNAFIQMTGADLGVLVTEVGLVYVPDVPAEGNFGVQQWGNVCTGGTDLPLGGFLALANRQGCRPTAASWGYVLLGQLQYNNALGTAVTLSPTIAFSHDVSGNTPAPISNYRQGRKSVSLQLNGSYQGAWRGGVSYTNFFGSNKYSDSVDRDFAAVNISYAF